VQGRSWCSGWCLEIPLEEEKIRMAYLEHGGTASVAGKERGMVAGERGAAGWFVFFLFLRRGGRPVCLKKMGLGLGFCLCCFLNVQNCPLKIFSSPYTYGWRFTYIENLYTCYLKKYCNNYCKDCLL